VQVRQLRHRLLQFRHDNSVVVVVVVKATPRRRHDNSDSTSTQDRKAFVTTVILLDADVERSQPTPPRGLHAFCRQQQQLQLRVSLTPVQPLGTVFRRI